MQHQSWMRPGHHPERRRSLPPPPPKTPAATRTRAPAFRQLTSTLVGCHGDPGRPLATPPRRQRPPEPGANAKSEPSSRTPLASFASVMRQNANRTDGQCVLQQLPASACNCAAQLSQRSLLQQPSAEQSLVNLLRQISGRLNLHQAGRLVRKGYAQQPGG